MTSHPREIRTPTGVRRLSRTGYDRWERFVTGRPGLLLLFLWAVAEATVWPILPDFLLLPMGLAARRRTARLLPAALAGMALGGVCTFISATLAPDAMLRLLHHLPLLTSAQIGGAHTRLAAHGAAAFWLQPWSGIPFKAWAVAAGSMALNPAQVIPIFIVARGLRLSLVALVAALVGERFRGLIRECALLLAVAYVVLFLSGLWLVSRLSG